MNAFCSCASFFRSGCRAWIWCVLLAALSGSSARGSEGLAIPIDAHLDGRAISANLVGLHQVYTFTPDHVFEKGDFTEWVKEKGFSVSRYPGGTTVKYWDWEDPTGQPFSDPMLPSFDPKLNKPESEWMSLDEYLDFVKAAGMTPLIGVNSYLGAVHGGESEMIEKAVRLVRHVKERGFGGGFYYIGNEEGHKHGGHAGYARSFRKYAERMKAEDPNIKIFWNHNNPNEKSIREFLSNDGGTADGLETHGKWPYGGEPGLPSASREEWLEEVPLRDRKNGHAPSGGRIWRYAADEYRAIAKSMGRELLIANNEFGFGKEGNLGTFTRFEKGLLATELLMEMLIGDWDMTTFWDLTRDTEDGILDRKNAFRINPAGEGIAMLAEVQGGVFLHATQTENPSVHGFAARKKGGVYLYLLNKTVEPHSCKISMDPAGFGEMEVQILAEAEDGYGELSQSLHLLDGDLPVAELPPMSFAKIALRSRGEGVSVINDEMRREQPNIIWLMAEDIGVDLECYGMKGVSTPNLNRLAEEGARYTSVYCPSPICSPNRSAMMVGVDQTEIGAQHHRSKRDQPLPAPYKPMTYWLRNAGYTTIIGSDLVMGKGGKIDCNFKTRMLGSYDGVTQFGLFDKRLEYTEEDQPFFNQIQLQVTHRGDWWPGLRESAESPVSVDEIELPPYYADTPEIRRDWANYLDTIEYMDREVGFLMDELKSKGLDSNTVVIFVGDNGRCNLRGKGYLYEPGVHVPMIVWGPGIIEKGVVIDGLVSVTDITASILNLAGVEIPDYMSARPVFGVKDPDFREYVRSARDVWDEIDDCSRSIVANGFKYIVNHMAEIPWDAGQAYLDLNRPALHVMRRLDREGRLSEEERIFLQPRKPVEELYDLGSDPHEMRNLANDPVYSKTLERMRGYEADWLENHRDQGLEDLGKRQVEKVLKAHLVRDALKKDYPELWKRIESGEIVKTKSLMKRTGQN